LKEEQNESGTNWNYQAKVEAIPRREQELKNITPTTIFKIAIYLLSKTYSAEMSNDLIPAERGKIHRTGSRSCSEKPLNEPSQAHGSLVLYVVFGSVAF